jgi:hypothetical protein
MCFLSYVSYEYLCFVAHQVKEEKAEMDRAMKQMNMQSAAQKKMAEDPEAMQKAMDMVLNVS